MPTMTISNRFFRTERDKMYSDWKSAFWREVFQNSLDGLSDEISIIIEDRAEGGCRVTFGDNGTGMSRNTLEMVYFCLGETTKDSDSTIGGFGRARILTCFAMDRYEILTRISLVVGQGAEYDITEIPYRPGCTLVIDIGDATPDEMEKTLRDFIHRSHMEAQVTYRRGENTEYLRSDLRQGKLVRELTRNGETFATVHVNKGEKALKNEVLVRVRGACMYTLSTVANAQVIIDIDPAKSREVLTANRDGMHWFYNSVVTHYLEELAADTNSALTPKYKYNNFVMESTNGRNFQTSRRKSKETPTRVAVTSHAVTANYRPVNTGMGAGTAAFRDFGSFPEPESEEIRQDRWRDHLPAIHIIDECNNPEHRKVIPQYHPNGWTKIQAGDKSYFRGGERCKILLIWHAFCQLAVDALLEAGLVDEVSWTVGWYFGDNRAVCRSVAYGGHVFALNPLDLQGKMAFKISDKASMKKMMAVAMHEVSHVVASWHNEDWASAMTQIVGNFNEKEAFQAIRSAIQVLED